MELAEEFVVLRKGAFALENVDFDRRLVVGGCRECLALGGGDGGVGGDEGSHYTSQSLDAHAQRNYVEQKHVFNVAGEHTALDGGADGNDFVGVHAFGRCFAEEFLYNLLHGGNTGGAAYEDYFVDVGGCEAGVAESVFARFHCCLDELVGQLFESGACQLFHQVLGSGCGSGDVGQVDFCSGYAGKFYLGFLGSFFEALESHGVLSQVHAFVLEELVGEPVDDHVVEVVAAQVGVAVGGFNFEYAVAKFEDGDIECAAAEVEHGNLAVLVALVQSVGQCGCCRFVNDSAHVQACDFAGFLGGLAL